MPIETTRFDIQTHIATREDQVAYLEAVLEDGDPSLIAAALGDIAHAHGASQFSRETGLSRGTIDKALRPGQSDPGDHDEGREGARDEVIADPGLTPRRSPPTDGQVLPRPRSLEPKAWPPTDRT